MKTLAIVGAGPALGMAVAQRFGREGFRVGLIARNQNRLEGLAAELAGEGIHAVVAAADVRDLAGLAGAIGAVGDELGDIDVLEYSPLVNMADLELVTDMTIERAQEHFELHVLGAVTAVQQVLPGMLARGDGGLLFTTGGTAKWPTATHGSGCIAVAALRHYALMLSDAVSHRGVYVGTISIARSGERERLADLYWDMYSKRDRVEEVSGDPEAMHAFELLVLRGHAQWFPVPRLLDPPEPTTPGERRELLLGLHQAKLMAVRITDDPGYEPYLDDLVHRHGGDLTAPRCGADEVMA